MSVLNINFNKENIMNIYEEDYQHTPFVDDNGMIEAGDLDGVQPIGGEVTAPTLTPEMREALNSRLADNRYGCADEVWRLVWATATSIKPAQAELKSWRDLTDAELESLVGHWGTDSRQACLDLAALLKHKNPSHYIPPSTNIRGEATDAEVDAAFQDMGCIGRTESLRYVLAQLLSARAATSTKPVQSSELRVCPRHDYALADENGCAYCNDEKADKPPTPLQNAKDALHTLREAVYAVLSNEEHAFSGGMRSYQKGSYTWQVYEDLRIAAIASSQKGAV